MPRILPHQGCLGGTHRSGFVDGRGFPAHTRHFGKVVPLISEGHPGVRGLHRSGAGNAQCRPIRAPHPRTPWGRIVFTAQPALVPTTFAVVAGHRAGGHGLHQSGDPKADPGRMGGLRFNQVATGHENAPAV